MTGSSGYIGSSFVSALCADPTIDRVLGFDTRPGAQVHDRFVFDQLDVRDPTFAARLSGVDVLVHLAFVMDPIKDEVEMRDINVNGSHNVFKAAGKAGVGKIVYVSSAVVYGAHPDNDVPLTEDSPLRANLDFSYAAHKLEVEYVIREFRDDFPDTIVTVLRPAIVFGPHADNAWSHTLELPAWVGIQGYSPALQFVHEDDVCDALLHAVGVDLDGSYNLAAPGSLSIEEVLRLTGRRRFELPEPVAFGLADRLWSLGIAEAPSGLLHYLMHPWVVAVDKLSAAGFTPARSNREAFEETFARAGEYVRIGRRRVRRSDLRRGSLATLGVLTGVAGVRTVRRRRAIPGH